MDGKESTVYDNFDRLKMPQHVFVHVSSEYRQRELHLLAGADIIVQYTAEMENIKFVCVGQHTISIYRSIY